MEIADITNSGFMSLSAKLACAAIKNMDMQETQGLQMLSVFTLAFYADSTT